MKVRIHSRDDGIDTFHDLDIVTCDNLVGFVTNIIEMTESGTEFMVFHISSENNDDIFYHFNPNER